MPCPRRRCTVGLAALALLVSTSVVPRAWAVPPPLGQSSFYTFAPILRYEFGVRPAQGGLPNSDDGSAEVFTYERNVDSRTGRPRQGNSRAGCDPDDLFDGDTSGCLDQSADVLANPHVNQQLFAVLCSSSVGFSSLDPSVCVQSVLNPGNPVSGPVRLTSVIGALAAGRSIGKNTFFGLMNATAGLTASQFLGQTVGRFGTGTPSGVAGDLNGDGTVLIGFSDLPLVTLIDDADPCARTLADPVYAATHPAQTAECVTNPDPDGVALVGPPLLASLLANGLDKVLTDQEEALLGCGPFYGTSCDLDGIDLLNAEASYLLQSWPGLEGTNGTTALWDIFDFQVAQPGTFPAERMPNGQVFGGNEACGRFENNQFVIVAGCQPQFLPDGTLNPDWNRAVDGTSPSSPEALDLRDNGTAVDRLTLVDSLRHPYACADYTDRSTCQRFVSGGAAVSFNALMAFVGLSGPDPFLASDLVVDGVRVTEGEFALLPGAQQVQILDGLRLDSDNCRGYDPAAATPIGSVAGSCFKRPRIDELDVNDIFRTGACSFRQPQPCKAVRAVLESTVERSGGAAGFGRRDFVWHTGTDEPQCGDGIDNDRDGLTDGADFGCTAADDPSERDPRIACDDGVDNDGDGRTDFPDDPGCNGPLWEPEDPPCQDGRDNDGSGTMDFDGGQSHFGACSGEPGGCPEDVGDLDEDGVADPDPMCNVAWSRETLGRCGLGFELALLLPGLVWMRRRRTWSASSRSRP